MHTFLAPVDALAESRRLIAVLERRRDELPFADDILAAHLPAHDALERSSICSDDAVEAWRSALARRWDCEVAGRRLYKQVLRQIVEHYGSASAPEVQLLSRGEAEANSSPAELLHDLRRLQAALEMGQATLPFAPRRHDDVKRICGLLEAAIGAAQASEARRRHAALERRLAQEAYRRARAETQRALIEFYNGMVAGELAEVFV